MSVDRLHDTTDIPSRLLDVDDTCVFESRSLDEREEIIVERLQNPVVLQRIQKVFSVGIAQSSLVASSMDGPATTTQAVGDRNSDPLIAVQRSHASVALADLNSLT